MQKGDLSLLVTFATTLFKERRTNRNLGIVSLDRYVTRPDEEKFLEGVLKGVRDNNVVSVAAFVNDKLVGNCDIHRRGFYDVRHTGVLGIVIIDGYRRAGIGEKMMNVALREALRLGVWLLELQVFQTNVGAIHLYEKLGFKRVGVVPNKILRKGRFIDEVQMFADLRGTEKSTTSGRSES